MKSITLNEAVKFQDIFWHDGVYSPYEEVKDITYYPLVVAGEVGTLLNSFLKQTRSPNSYKKEIENDCADIFICFLIYLLVLQKKDGKNRISALEKVWNVKPVRIVDLRNFKKKCVLLIEKILSDDLKSTDSLEIFRSIKSLTSYVSNKNWQKIIDEFHAYAFEKFTEFENYTPDLWYRGSCYVDFQKLIDWGKKNSAELPPKRLLFLKRMASLQKNQQIKNRPHSGRQ